MKFLSLLAAIPFALATVEAQQTGTQQPVIPQIVTSGSGETQVTPDRARIDVAVETRAATASAAAAENARITTAVLAKIKTLGILDAQLGTSGYNVNAEYDYSRDAGRPRIIGYIARNTIRVEVRRIDQAGAVIDAGMSAGANNVHGLHFYSSNVDAARGRALAQAVQKARADAEVMAAAAGGRLGTLIELSSSSYTPQPPMPYMARMEVSAQANPTPINPGEQTLMVTVSARWRFISP